MIQLIEIYLLIHTKIQRHLALTLIFDKFTASEANNHKTLDMFGNRWNLSVRHKNLKKESVFSFNFFWYFYWVA